MNNYIICTIDLFDDSQQIYLVSNERCEHIGTSSLEDLGYSIASCCNQFNTFSVKLSGNKKFAKALGDAILSYNNIHFKNNEIEIEVI